jgi:catechol 2,3-dioxygenase-like lactoylglutathione lyase family enzyme
MITGFNHTSFTVADMDKSVKFWTENLGFKASSVSPRQGDWQADVTGMTSHRIHPVSERRRRWRRPATGLGWGGSCLPGGR